MKNERSEYIANKICMFCGKKLGQRKEISSWYNGCHSTCLKNYNQRGVK